MHHFEQHLPGPAPEGRIPGLYVEQSLRSDRPTVDKMWNPGPHLQCAAIALH